MYTLSSWRSHLDIVPVDLRHQEPARNERDPFTVYVPGDNTQVSRMNNLHPSDPSDVTFGIVVIDFLHQEPARTVGDPFTAYDFLEVTQVSRMTDVHP